MDRKIIEKIQKAWTSQHGWSGFGFLDDDPCKIVDLSVSPKNKHTLSVWQKTEPFVGTEAEIIKTVYLRDEDAEEKLANITPRFDYLRQTRLKLELHQNELALALGYEEDGGARSLRRWEAGTRPIPGGVWVAIRWMATHGLLPEQEKHLRARLGDDIK